MAYPYLKEVQEGLYQALRGDSLLVGLLGGADKVTDAVLHEARYPYVMIHRLKQRANETQGHREAIVTAELIVYSDYNGMKEVAEIGAEICRIVMAEQMILSAVSLTAARIIDVEQRRGRDGLTREALVTIEFFVEGA
jgi:hypothetical protein